MARTTPGHPSDSNEAGFSLIEVVVVLLIAMLLLNIAADGLGPARQAAALESAEYSFRSVQARARAHAIEGDEQARIELDPFADRLLLQVGVDTLEILDFRDELGVDVDSRVDGSSAVLVQCMTSRGLGDGACTSFDLPADISFIQGDRVRSIRLLPLGQVLER